MLKGSSGARLPATGPRHMGWRALPGHRPSPPPLTGERLGPLPLPPLLSSPRWTWHGSESLPLLLRVPRFSHEAPRLEGPGCILPVSTSEFSLRRACGKTLILFSKLGSCCS